MADERASIVLVHGVGAKRRGEFLESYLIGAARIVNGETFSKATPEPINPFKHVVEVFWGDTTGFRSQSIWWIARPVLVFGFVLRFLLALAQVSSNGWDRSASAASRRSVPAVALKYFLFSVAVPSPIVFVLPLHYVLNDGPIKWLLMVSAALPSLVICYYLRRHDLACRIGLWAGAVLLPMVMLALAFGGGGVADWAGFSAKCVSVVQAGTCALVVVSLLDVLSSAVTSQFRGRNVRHASWITAAHPYLLKIFGVTFPFAVLGGGFGALGWATNLAASLQIGVNKDKFAVWSEAYQATLNYDLAMMEALFATVLFLVGLFVVLLVAAFFVALVLYRRRAQAPRLGRAFRQGLSVLLVLYALLTSAFIGLFVTNFAILPGSELARTAPTLEAFTSLFFGSISHITKWLGMVPSGNGKAELNVLEIYAASALRLVSFLPMDHDMAGALGPCLELAPLTGGRLRVFVRGGRVRKPPGLYVPELRLSALSPSSSLSSTRMSSLAPPGLVGNSSRRSRRFYAVRPIEVILRPHRHRDRGAKLH